MPRRKSKSPNKPVSLALPPVPDFLNDAPPVETSHERGGGDNDESDKEVEDTAGALPLAEDVNEPVLQGDTPADLLRQLELQPKFTEADSPNNNGTDEQHGAEGPPKRRDNNFLEKLWQWLDSEPSANIMQFSVNGRYLLILNPDAVPAALDQAGICKHKNYGSFQRQCCIYGWRRIPQMEVPKLVLDDDEEPGATISTLGEHIKVMQHETLSRDSDRADVRSVTRKAKPKPSRAKDAETRAVANVRMAAEEAERRAKQKEQEELVALHKAEEKRRQDEQRRREQLKRERSHPEGDIPTSMSGQRHRSSEKPDDNVDQDFTYDPALSMPTGLSLNFALDPILGTTTPPMNNNALVAAASIPKQANSNTATTRTKAPKAVPKKRKASTQVGPHKENDGVDADIPVRGEVVKKTKKQPLKSTFDNTVPFDADRAMTALGIGPSIDYNADSALENFTHSTTTAYNPVYATALMERLGSSITSSINPVPAANTLVAPATTYDPLPPSLQEAFLNIDKANTATEGQQGFTLETVGPSLDLGSMSGFDDSDLTSMIDPAMTTVQSAPSSMLTTGYPSTSASSGSGDTSSGAYPYNINSGGAVYDPVNAISGSATISGSNPTFSAPFYYQPPSTDYSSMLDPQLNSAPPYFSSAFTGLADLQATNW